MTADSTVDDTDESRTASHLRTDGGEAETAEENGSAEEDKQEQQESAETDEPATIEADDEAVAEQTGDVGVEPQTTEESDAEASEKDADENSESASSLDGEGDTAGIIEVRNQVIELSTDVIGRGLDGIIEVTRNDESWRAVVEIIERRSVPDTQDILGQYEIELDKEGEVIGYRRLEKYRRSDTGPTEH